MRVWNFTRAVGLRAVARKILSRRAESLRNRRVVAVGLGEIVEIGDQACPAIGTQVIFSAPSHPRCVERVAVPVSTGIPRGFRPPDPSLNPRVQGLIL
jgi:hypothetical protein